jgi:hypothetical protein
MQALNSFAMRTFARVPVPEATVRVSAEERARRDEHPDRTQLMKDAINFVLEGARRKNKDIQTFDELHLHLARHPEDDEAFCRLRANSGYLELWKIEQEQNPWIYDIALMSAAPTDQIAAYCQSLLSDEEGGPNRNILNRGGYKLFSHQYGLLFFQLMADLYGILAEWHPQRLRVAKAWLDANDYTVPAEKPFWFLTRRNGSRPWNNGTRHGRC